MCTLSTESLHCLLVVVLVNACVSGSSNSTPEIMYQPAVYFGNTSGIVHLLFCCGLLLAAD